MKVSEADYGREGHRLSQVSDPSWPLGCIKYCINNSQLYARHAPG